MLARRLLGTSIGRIERAIWTGSSIYILKWLWTRTMGLPIWRDRNKPQKDDDLVVQEVDRSKLRIHWATIAMNDTSHATVLSIQIHIGQTQFV
eukprot:5860517-Amphidinium_carterae.1